MTQVRCGEWLLEVEVEATRRAYEAIRKGDPETCMCVTCRNFVAARHLAYPTPALDLYSQLGVRADREAETTEFGIAGNADGHLYTGWHHFFGRILVSSDGACELAPGFQIWFREGHSCAEPPFQRRPDVVQAEFSTVVPWVIDEPPEAGG